MDLIVNMHEAKTRLSQLVEAASGGQVVIIAKAGQPKVRLVPVKAQSSGRTPGTLKDKMALTDDLEAPLPGSISQALGLAHKP